MQVLTITKYFLTISNNFLVLSCSISVYFGLLWTILVYLGAYLCISVHCLPGSLICIYKKESPSILECLSVSWSIMFYLKPAGAFSDYLGLRLSLAISDYLKIARAILDFLRLSWLSLTISNYLWLSWAISGYLWLSLTISDYLRISLLSIKYQGASRNRREQDIAIRNFFLLFFFYFFLHERVLEELALLKMKNSIHPVCLGV